MAIASPDVLRALRGSFRARFILGAVLWIAAGVALSGYMLAGFYREQVDLLFYEELDGHAEELIRLVARDASGRIHVQPALVDPRFEQKGSGWYWQIEAAETMVGRSESLGDFVLQVDRDPPLGNTTLRRSIGPAGPLLLLERSARAPLIDQDVRIGIGADQRVLADILRPFNRRLGLSLGVIALGLIGAAIAQIAFGLQPLRRLQKALLAVRTGESEKLPEDVPSELKPLVSDLNALLEAQQTTVSRARAQAGNLAHALKTPLAILMDEGTKLVAAGRREEGNLVLQECDRMRRQIDFQLARARAAASRAGPAPVAPVAPTMAAVIAALSRLYRDRNLHFSTDEVGEQIAVACDPDDLSEMLANLVDNAAKWARSRIHVTVELRGNALAQLRVEDDGPGMPVAARELVFKSGERLDESAPGSGLGLAIVRDLAKLYGGRSWIEASALGGAAVCIELPLARAAAVQTAA